MLCRLCEEYFVKEKNFLTLFEFPEICSDCYIKYQPKVNYEVFPIDNGEIEYYYLYEDIQLNKKQRVYLMKHFKILIDLVKDEDRKVVIIIDEINKTDIINQLDLIKAFRKIVILSLVRYNFEDSV
jgi:hypothetical protein